MYRPPFTIVDDEPAIRAFVRDVGAGELVTGGPDGYPMATLLPVVWQGDRVVAHLARANEHWRSIEDGAPALLLVGGLHGYVSPGWYASKAEHGRVVPTWNYETVQLRGRVHVFDDRDRLREVVTQLTDVHEAQRARRWHVEDAPEAYLRGQLEGIVGVELEVERVEAKAKLSQNRSDADRQGVVAGLEAEGDPRSASLAERMRDAPG